MSTTLIIGKNSNLSNFLHKKLNNHILLSSQDLYKDIDILHKYKELEINIIFNNFHPATKLNNITDPEKYIINSIGVTSKILTYCLNNNIKINKIIYTSSSSVYGSNIFCKESDVLKPMNLHASLKVSNEKMIETFCNKYNIDYTIARLFNMYGGDDNFSIISKLINAVRHNSQITIVNNGNAIRDFIHIKDVVDIYVKLLNKQNIKILNIGTGIGYSVKSIVDLLNKQNIKIQTKNIIVDEIKTSTANNENLIKLLNKNSFLQVEDYIKFELSI